MISATNMASWRALCAALVTLGCFSGASASAETVRLEGSSGFAQELMAPYKDQIEAQTGEILELTPTSSAEGLLALLKGKADVAMIWGPLEALVAPLRKSDPHLPYGRLREFRVAKSWVAYSINPGNPVRSVSLAQLRQILSGHVDNWRAVGGSDLPIHVVSARDGGGKRATEEILFGGNPMTPRSGIMVDNSAEVIDAVAHDPGALGISRASIVVDRLPKLRTSVPIGQSLSLVTLDAPSDAMRAVIVATRSVVFGEVP